MKNFFKSIAKKLTGVPEQIEQTLIKEIESIPEISKEPTEEEILSAKLRDKMLALLDKYPAHEWIHMDEPGEFGRFFHPKAELILGARYYLGYGGRNYILCKIFPLGLSLRSGDASDVLEKWLEQLNEESKRLTQKNIEMFLALEI